MSKKDARGNEGPSRKTLGRKTSKNRKKRQGLKRKYQAVREEAQLRGIIPTRPEGAVRSEVVDPRSQEDAQIPSIDRAAVRRGWAVPEEAKVRVVDRLLEPFEQEDADPYLLKENAKVLVQADQKQYERDNPKEAGLAKGASSVQVNQVNGEQVVQLNPFDLYKKTLEEVTHDEVEQQIQEVRALPAPTNGELVEEGKEPVKPAKPVEPISISAEKPLEFVNGSH